MIETEILNKRNRNNEIYRDNEMNRDNDIYIEIMR